MKIYLAILLSFFSAATLSAQTVAINDLKTGDLLFQNLDCGDMCDAIEAVTAGWEGHSFSHVGIVEKRDDGIYVWESMGPGVRSVLLDSFCIRSKHALVLGRLKKRHEKLIPAALQFIHNSNGLGYDEEFLYNNGKYYCSELIYDAFKDANRNKPFFKLYPMTFKKPGSREYFPVWINYYHKLNVQIPEGAPGCNPGGLSRSRQLKIFLLNK